jgi:hypothetical protein
MIGYLEKELVIECSVDYSEEISLPFLHLKLVHSWNFRSKINDKIIRVRQFQMKKNKK